MKKVFAIIILLSLSFALYCLSFMSAGFHPSFMGEAKFATQSSQQVTGLATNTFPGALIAPNNIMTCKTCSVEHLIILDFFSAFLSLFSGSFPVLIVVVFILTIGSITKRELFLKLTSSCGYLFFKDPFLIQHRVVVMRN